MSTESGKVVPVEDLVKIAIKEAMAKRLEAEAIKPSALREAFEDLAETASSIPSVKKITASDLKPNQILATELFGTAVRFSPDKDFVVTVFNEEDWDEKIRGFIPKIDPTYYLDKDHVTNILKGWEMNEKILAYGATGVGKTSLFEQLCAHTKRPFIRINSTGDMDSSMVFGSVTAKDGSTGWADGLVTEAVRYGAVVAWDEWDVTPPEIAMGMQWLLEESGKLFLKEMPGTAEEKFITPHQEFRIVAIGNTQGQGDDTGAHSGTNVQNTATLDRFTTAMKFEYLKEDVEINLIQNKFPLRNIADTKALVRFINVIRQGYTSGQLGLTMSPRSALSICKKMAFGYSLLSAMELTYINKLTETHQKVARELFRKVYGTKTT